MSQDNDQYSESHYTKVFSEPTGYYTTIEKKIKTALGLLEIHKNGKVLDVGCGDGGISKLIEKKTQAQVYGIDVNKNILKKAKKRGIITKCVDIDSENLPKGPFDVVFCGDVIEHIVHTEGLLKKVYKVLKPDGYLIVSIPNVAAWYNRVLLLFGFLPAWIESSTEQNVGTPFANIGYGHLRAFTKKSLLTLLRLNGFRPEIIKGMPILGDKTRSEKIERVWNKVDSVFAKSSSLASLIIVKARKI